MPAEPNQATNQPRGDGSAAARQTAGVIAPPPLLYAVPLAVGLLLQHWHPIRLPSPDIARLIGIASVLLGLVGFPAIVAFRRANTSPKPWEPTTALVTSGPYRISRNPMYLGFTLLYVGVSLWANAAWPLFFLPVVLAVMLFGVIRREETYLVRVFGPDYVAYCRRVRRWL